MKAVLIAIAALLFAAMPAHASSDTIALASSSQFVFGGTVTADWTANVNKNQQVQVSLYCIGYPDATQNQIVHITEPTGLTAGETSFVIGGGTYSGGVANCDVETRLVKGKTYPLLAVVFFSVTP